MTHLSTENRIFKEIRVFLSLIVSRNFEKKLIIFLVETRLLTQFKLLLGMFEPQLSHLTPF